MGPQGRTIAPLDETFVMLGGGVAGSGGDVELGLRGIMVAWVWAIMAGRKRRIAFQFPLKPIWAEWTNALRWWLPSSAVAVMNAYPCRNARPTVRRGARLGGAGGWSRSRPRDRIPVVIVALVA